MDRASASEAENMGSTPVGRVYKFARFWFYISKARVVFKLGFLKPLLSYLLCADQRSFLPLYRLYKKIK